MSLVYIKKIPMSHVNVAIQQSRALPATEPARSSCRSELVHCESRPTSESHLQRAWEYGCARWGWEVVCSWAHAFSIHQLKVEEDRQSCFSVIIKLRFDIVRDAFNSEAQVNRCKQGADEEDAGMNDETSRWSLTSVQHHCYSV